MASRYIAVPRLLDARSVGRLLRRQRRAAHRLELTAPCTVTRRALDVRSAASSVHQRGGVRFQARPLPNSASPRGDSTSMASPA